MANPLIELHAHGQSFWLDNIRREWLQDGTLANMVETRGLRGLTSNPAILQKAITSSQAYDEQLAELARAGASTMRIYEQLAISDIRGAADILRPVYDASKGVDGFVSLEVSPTLAHDTQGTIDEGKRLFAEVDRPNVMIKVPGTPACIPAIEELIASGVHINVTLLFSTQHYDAAAEAYMRGLERRLELGLPLDVVSSVASVFLSRIDSLVDALLSPRIIGTRRDAHDVGSPEALLGNAAIACAKVTYASFCELESSNRWRRLASSGARVQRPLWASTSTKSPIYRDVRYVEPLIGPHTVNTLPDATVDAFEDHGLVANTINDGVEEARATLRHLYALGIDIDAACQQLQDEGVAKFVKPFGDLLGALSTKRAKVVGGQMAVVIEAGKLSKPLAEFSEALDQSRVPQRLWRGDATLWRQDARATSAIAQRLGWLGLPETMVEALPELEAFVDEVRAEGMTDVVVLGMGGSSLTADVVAHVFGRTPGYPSVRILDSTHPVAVQSLTEELALEKTLFLVASKSGTTLETISLYRHFTALYDELPGVTGRHFVAITDAETELVSTAAAQGFRKVFINASDVGGRFSALSYFGLVPMALAGVDVRGVLAAAREQAEATAPWLDAGDNPALQLGALLATAHSHGRDALTLVASPRLARMADWLEQLIAESTGKRGMGMLPVFAEPALFEAGAFSDDASLSRRLFCVLQLAGDSKAEVPLEALRAQKHPIATITLPSALGIGQAFLFFELVTAIAGVALGINPFDEPDVRAAKEATNHVLAAVTDTGSVPALGTMFEQDGLAMMLGPALAARYEQGNGMLTTLRRALDEAVAEGRYVALMAYVPPTQLNRDALEELRGAIRRRWSSAVTTSGFGPRLLHSIGQLYKGGPNKGIYLQIVDDSPAAVAIPGRTYDFGVLVAAQAIGDFRALSEAHRPTMRVEVQGPVAEGLRRLAQSLAG